MDFDEETAGITSDMQSIGRNCEFGFIQRKHFGTEPNSLMRWAGCSREKLAEAIQNRFDGLADSMSGKADPPGRPPETQHWFLIDRRYDIIFHSGEKVAERTVEEANDRVRARLKRAAEAQIQDIETADKLFVFSDATMAVPADALPLFRAVRSVGPAWLLAVLQDEAKAGTAHLADEGLIAGYVRKLTEPGDAIGFDYEAWPAMLREAHRLWKAIAVP